jgi:hypothetical protein
MKRILLSAFILVFAGSLAYAQQPAGHKANAPIAMSAKTVETKSMTGKVKSITLGGQAKGGKSEIAIVDEKSMERIFPVKSTTTVYDTDFKAMSFDKIKKDDSVKVKYTKTKDGDIEATSVNLLK